MRSSSTRAKRGAPRERAEVRELVVAVVVLGERVDAGDGVALGDEALAQVRADEPGGAGDQCPLHDAHSSAVSSHNRCHRQAARALVRADHVQQLAHRGQVLRVHLRVMQHHAQWRGLCGPRGQLLADRVASRAGRPCAWRTSRPGRAARAALRGRARRRCGRATGRRCQLDQRRAGVGGAAVPRRGEHRLEGRAEQLEKPAPAVADVGELRCGRAGRAELALAPLGLVAAVRVAVLVQPNGWRSARSSSAAASAGVSVERDRGEVDRHGALGEDVEQRHQAVVAPARVVVAEEERDGLGRGVERGAQRTEPGAHDATSRTGRAGRGKARRCARADWRSSARCCGRRRGRARPAPGGTRAGP